MATNYRCVNKNGSLTVPRMMRQDLGMHPGTALDMTTTDDGGLLIRKHAPSCHLCGGTKYIGTYQGLTLCRGCYYKLGEAIDNG